MIRHPSMQFLLIVFVAVGSLVQFPTQAGAATPGEVQYQGLLLDDIGNPVNGLVELSFEFFDAASGGTSLWSESHMNVDVVDGVYDVALGSITPIAASVLEGGNVHLEVTVDSEKLTPRQRLLAVPYAVRARDADNVGGVSGTFVEQILLYADWDGGDPPADDPSEGLDDIDGDGRANFIDPDNDGDGRSDVLELAQGTPMNIPSPRVDSFSPAVAEPGVTTIIRVNGNWFEPGMTVAFGSENPIPSNLTQTSFDIDVGPQPAGVKTVVLTLPSGLSTSLSFELRPMVLTFKNFGPLVPPDALFDQTTVVTLYGTDFTPWMTVSFGSENPTPQNVTLTSAEVTVGPQSVGNVTVTLTHPNGTTDSEQFNFTLDDTKRVFMVGPQDADFGGIAGADALCNAEAATNGWGSGYRAWLGDDGSSPATVFGKTHGPYRLIDGTIVANDWNDLVDGVLLVPIGAGEGVWSNVSGMGGATLSGDDCGNWTSTAGTGRRGNSGSSSSWSNGFFATCDTPLYLYCFED